MKKILFIFILFSINSFANNKKIHKKIVETVLQHEGVELFRTKRELSKFGIRENTLKAYNKKYKTKYEIKNLRKEDAVKISINLLEEYRIDEIKNKNVKLVVYDTIFNAGYRGGNIILQRALKRYTQSGIKIDGVLGSKTIEELNNIKNEKRFITIFNQERLNYYQGIKDWEVYKEGWLKRINYYNNLRLG